MTENNRLIPIIDDDGIIDGTYLMINTNYCVNQNYEAQYLTADENYFDYCYRFSAFA